MRKCGYVIAEYRNLVELLEMKMPSQEPEVYVRRFANMLSVDERISRKAYSIVSKAKHDDELTAGMNPRGLAAGALYIAALSSEKPLKQERLARRESKDPEED